MSTGSAIGAGSLTSMAIDTIENVAGGGAGGWLNIEKLKTNALNMACDPIS